MDRARLFTAGLLTAIIALGALGVRFAEGQEKAQRLLTLKDETVRVSLSDLNLDPATTYGIDYYDLSDTSYSTQAADVQMTIGNLCHVGQIPRTTYQILHSCPAEKNKANRLKEWREFVAGKGRAPIPKKSDLYIVRNGREIVPLVERELTKGDNLNSKSAIGLSFSPACAFRNPARGEKVTELCAQSLPVRLPPFAATITGGEVVVTRLASGPASAYLVFIAQGQEVGRVTVRVEEKVVTLPGGSQPQVASPQAPGRVCSFGGRNYGAGETVVVFPSASVPFGQRCEGVSFFCRQPDPKKPLVSWHRAGNRRAEPQGVLDCRVETPPCLPGQNSVNYKYIDGDDDGYFVPAIPAPGKEFASVCLLKGKRLPHRDPVTRKAYAMTTLIGSVEDARCDGDALRHVYVDLQRYVGDGDGDGFYAEYQTPLKGCIKRPINPGYLGYLERPRKADMPIMEKVAAGRAEPQSTDGDPTKPGRPNPPGPNPQGPNPRDPDPLEPTLCRDPNALNHGQELPCLYPTCGDGKVEGNEDCDPPDDKTCIECCSSDSTRPECQCVLRPELCTENPCVSNPTGPGCDPCKENPELCPRCGCRELTSHSYRVQVNITTFGGPSDSGVTSTERGSVDGLRLRSRDPKSELYTAWPLPSAEKLLGLPDTSDCLGPEKESWEGEKIAAANEALKDYLVRITYVDPTGDYRTIEVPINDRGPGKATRWDASERVWRDLGVWKSDEDVKSTNPNDPAHMVELEIQLIPRNGVCP